MEEVIERCAGLDVHKATVAACDDHREPDAHAAKKSALSARIRLICWHCAIGFARTA
jgi:hypothetical protein